MARTRLSRPGTRVYGDDATPYAFNELINEKTVALDFNFDDYKIGVPLIDADHLSLFQEVSKLYDLMDQDAPLSEMQASIDFLYQYVGAHFAREEQLMKEKNYPLFIQHKGLHLELKKIVYATRMIFKSHPEKIDKDKLKSFLYNWLSHHILTIDAKLEPYINGPEGQVDPALAIGQPDLAQSIPELGELVEVTVKVPANRKEIIDRCAYIQAQSTPEAQDLEELALSGGGMSEEEAEKLASAVLK